MKAMTSTAIIFRIAGGLLSFGIATIVGLIQVRMFAKRNDSWIKRGALMSAGGLLIFIILGGPAAWAESLTNALMSFGSKAETTPTLPVIGFIVRSIAFGFFFQGIAVIMASYVYEVTGSRYLDRVTPTRRMKRRYKQNEEALEQNDKPDRESIAFGLIVDDPIPWRTSRYGKICARPINNMGHGAIVGATGTGKTATAISLAYQSATLDSAVFYMDFKASRKTLNDLKKAAIKAGKKFYSFDLGTGSTETSWYDPLDWPGTPSEKASMIVDSLQFPEDGSAAYYRGVATEWLNLQFEVLQEVGLYSGESSFDFLYETSNPAKIKERIAPLRRGNDRQRRLYTTFTERADAGSMKELTGLRQNLAIVVNAGGERLRPQSTAPAILMSRAAEEGAVVYFGLSASTNIVALKTIGSLILRNLGVLVGERMREANRGALRPILTLVDEASRLQDRAVVLDNVLATAREAEIYLWMITQSFSTWPKSSIVEMTTNVWTYVAFRVQDSETAETLVSTLEDVPVLEEMTEDKVRHRAFQGDVKERSGEGRTTLTTGPFLSDAPMGITSMEDLHAYVWFTGSWTRATIEEWKPKRLKKPDAIRNDAPLVKIVFLDYETEEEPIKGSTFSDLVTSVDEITYNMENTTLKRTRRESLTDDDDYSNIHLPGSPGRATQWAGSETSPGGRLSSSSYAPGGHDEYLVSDADEPVWDNAPSSNQPGVMPDNDGITWEAATDDVDDDTPPVSHFYRPQPVTQNTTVAQSQESAATNKDEDSLLWESDFDVPANPVGGKSPVDEVFAPDRSDEVGNQLPLCSDASRNSTAPIGGSESSANTAPAEAASAPPRKKPRQANSHSAHSPQRLTAKPNASKESEAGDASTSDRSVEEDDSQKSAKPSTKSQPKKNASDDWL